MPRLYLKLRQAGQRVNHKLVDWLCPEVGLQTAEEIAWRDDTFGLCAAADRKIGYSYHGL